MIRIVIENLLLFLLPTLVYLAYTIVMRGQAGNDTRGHAGTGASILDDAPLLWLFVAGAALVIVTLIAFGSTSGGRPEQGYEPPVLKDGHIQPGHVK